MWSLDDCTTTPLTSYRKGCAEVPLENGIGATQKPGIFLNFAYIAHVSRLHNYSNSLTLRIPIWDSKTYFVAKMEVERQLEIVSDQWIYWVMKVCWNHFLAGVIWVFPKIGVPQNGWFMMENPIKWMIWGTTIFGNIHNPKKHHPGKRHSFSIGQL